MFPGHDVERHIEEMELTSSIVDVVALARAQIGRSRYIRGIPAYHAPNVVDCSSFTKWLYGRKGIWLPRLALLQRDQGEAVAKPGVGDLVFTTGYLDLYHNDPADGVGHVGIATGEGTVVHAAGQKTGVLEVPYEDFVGKRGLRGIRRIAAPNILTVEFPPDRSIEYSEDIRWMILGRY